MADALQCPVCDVEIPYQDEDGKRSLSQLLGAGISTAVADHTETQLREHLAEHSVEDFVTALVMADRYIEILEGERDEAVKWRTEVEERIARGPVQRPAANPAFDQFAGTPPPAAPRPPGYETEFIQPERRAGFRQRVDPDKTLIPHIPAGQRPEGAVGRRT